MAVADIKTFEVLVRLLDAVDLVMKDKDQFKSGIDQLKQSTVENNDSFAKLEQLKKEVDSKIDKADQDLKHAEAAMKQADSNGVIIAKGFADLEQAKMDFEKYKKSFTTEKTTATKAHDAARKAAQDAMDELEKRTAFIQSEEQRLKELAEDLQGRMDKLKALAG
jgi:DNA repair exonuclease SbcCD ATPase subunit